MPAGRPTKYRRKFHCADYIARSKQGKSLAQIAAAWEVDRDTVQEWKRVHPEFSAAVQKGRQYAEAWYMDLGQASMLGQAKIEGKSVPVNLGMFCWLTKNMFRWSDKVETVSRAEERHRPLKDLTDEELDALDEGEK